MGWLIALGVLALLAILPLGVSARYDGSGALIKLIAGPVRVTLYPGKKKDKTSKTQNIKEKKTKKDTSSAKKKKGGKFSDFFPLIQAILNFLDALRWKLRVNRLELKLTLAADDPCDLAVNYGRAWTALGNLLPILESHLVIKKRDLEVECDFTADTTVIYARADLTVTLGRILSLGAVHGFYVLREYLKIAKMRKGGAKL